MKSPSSPSSPSNQYIVVLMAINHNLLGQLELTMTRGCPSYNYMNLLIFIDKNRELGLLGLIVTINFLGHNNIEANIAS
jgi:hypothetical protein